MTPKPRDPGIGRWPSPRPRRQSNLRVNCRYRGCTVILDRRLMAAHEAACPRRFSA